MDNLSDDDEVQHISSYLMQNFKKVILTLNIIWIRIFFTLYLYFQFLIIVNS
jgi:hypothetical protein